MVVMVLEKEMFTWICSGNISKGILVCLYKTGKMAFISSHCCKGLWYKGSLDWQSMMSVLKNLCVLFLFSKSTFPVDFPKIKSRNTFFLWFSRWSITQSYSVSQFSDCFCTRNGILKNNSFPAWFKNGGDCYLHLFQLSLIFESFRTEGNGLLLIYEVFC